MRSPLALIALLSLTGCLTDDQSVEAGPLQMTAVGRIDAAQEARHLVAAVDGRIAAVHVRRGEAVHAGQLLVAIECSPLDSAIPVRIAEASMSRAAADTVMEGARSEERAAAQARLVAAQSRAKDATDAMTRTEGLRDRGFVTLREIEARRNAAAAAEAEAAAQSAQLATLQNGPRASETREAMARARGAAAEVRSARAAAEQCHMRSPITGTVLQLLRREGEFSGASQGSPIIVVGNLDRLIVRAEVNERDAASISIGQTVTIWVEGGGTRWRGYVTELAGVMGRRSARSLDPTDRFDRDTREAIIAIDSIGAPRLVGLRVMVGFDR